MTNDSIKRHDDVFAALDLPQAGESRLKAELTVRMRILIEKEGLSQSDAAARLGVAQPDLSTLLRGKTRGFSVERLMRCLVALGQDIDISLKPHTDPATPARVKLLDHGETA